MKSDLGIHKIKNINFYNTLQNSKISDLNKFSVSDQNVTNITKEKAIQICE